MNQNYQFEKLGDQNNNLAFFIENYLNLFKLSYSVN